MPDTVTTIMVALDRLNSPRNLPDVEFGAPANFTLAIEGRITGIYAVLARALCLSMSGPLALYQR